MADEQKKDEGIVEINMKDLKGILAEAVKGMDLPQIAALKAELEAVNRKSMFPSGDGAIFEGAGKSIVDTRFFSKDYVRGPMAVKDGPALGAQLRGMNGPFLSLSPTMEKFATIAACGGNAQKLAALGVSVADYNAEVRETYKAVFGAESKGFLSTTDAGALVPTEFLATVVEFATSQSAILGKLWRIPMNSMILKVPKLVQAAGSYFGGITLYHPNEGAQKTETKPSFDTLTFTAKKLIGLCPLSDELIGDSSLNIINYLTGLFVRAFQYKTEGEVISGTGANNQMTGILADAATNLVARTTAGTLKYEDLISLEAALDENFNNLSFISRRATISAVRKQKDTNGQPVYHDGFTTFLGASFPPQLLGYPIFKTRNAPAMGVKGDVILGDLGFYIWAMRQEMTIDTSKDWRFDFDQTALRFVVRQDGAPGVSSAFAVLDGTAS